MHLIMEYESLTDEELGIVEAVEPQADGYHFNPQFAAPDPRIIERVRGMESWPAQRTTARNAADYAGHPEFIAPCFYHGPEAWFDTQTGACLLCVDMYAALPPSARYKAAMGTSYIDTCPTHGPASHRFGTTGCAMCRDAKGRPVVGGTARAAARRGGARTYQDTCATCGETAHGVASGRCLTCFTTMGRPRTSAAAGPPGNPVRTAARRTGATTYLATCAVHGETAHHTVRGKCLECFNTLGMPRKRPANPHA